MLRTPSILELWSAEARQVSFSKDYVKKTVDSGPQKPDKSISVSIMLRKPLVPELWSSQARQVSFSEEYVKNTLTP